jgi:hypothetical protein
VQDQSLAVALQTQAAQALVLQAVLAMQALM